MSTSASPRANRRCAPEFGQARVELAADRVELRVAGIAQAQHGELELLERGRALAEQEFDEAARIVRRIAFALGADDDVEQALAGQFAGRIGIGAQQSRRQSGRFGLACNDSATRRALPVWLPNSTVAGRTGCGEGLTCATCAGARATPAR